MNKKKILFVIPYLHDGGAERALSNITTHFPEEYDIDILVNSDKVQDYPFRGNIITLGIDKIKKTDSVLFQFLVFLKRVSKLRKLKKSGDYLACISFMDSANVSNILATRKKCKTIVSVRVSLKKSENKPQYKYIVSPLVKMLYNKADKIVAVSRGIQKELVESFGLKKEKVVAIENGYDVESIIAQSKEPVEEDVLNKIKDKKVIITAGRLSEQKGQWHLIRAFNEVQKEIPDSVLIILGEGELRPYLEELVKGYGLEDKVLLLGQTTNPFMYERYADVFVMPSLYEGFPNALAEAVCLGLPCVATDFETGAREIMVPELLDDENKIKASYYTNRGVLVPSCSGNKLSISEKLEDSEQELAKVILDHLNKDRLIIQNIDNNHGLSISDAVSKWIELINQ